MVAWRKRKHHTPLHSLVPRTQSISRSRQTNCTNDIEEQRRNSGEGVGERQQRIEDVEGNVCARAAIERITCVKVENTQQTGIVPCTMQKCVKPSPIEIHRHSEITKRVTCGA